jgi:hypothetical protein
MDNSAEWKNLRARHAVAHCEYLWAHDQLLSRLAETGQGRAVALDAEMQGQLSASKRLTLATQAMQEFCRQRAASANRMEVAEAA